MPFFVIKGSFHLVGQTRTGNPSGFSPDGDSIQFKPNQPRLLDRLEQVGSPYKLTAIGSTQLRFEGIDALELHFEGSHQPRPLADDARDYLTGLLTMNPVPYKPPDNRRVLPPLLRDGTRGYILSRALEAHGRPVAFAFTDDPPARDGSSIFLNAQQLRKSLNYKSVRNGHSYPLFYDTLFANLRTVLANAAIGARSAGRGLWGSDRTTSGTRVRTQADLEANGVVFPKLFRRLTTFLDTSTGLGGFLPWLAATTEEVLDLSTGNFTHFDNLTSVTGDRVLLKLAPEHIVFVSAKPRTTGAAPWLDL